MTNVVVDVNTNVMARCGSIAKAMEIDVHGRLVRLLAHVLRTPGPDGERRSQQQIADATGGKVSQAAISQYLANGRRAKLETAQAIGRALGVDPEYFTSDRETHPEDALGASSKGVSANDELLASFAAERDADGRPIPAEVVDRLRRDVHLWEGKLTHDILVMMLPVATERAAQLREPPPVPAGKRRVPPGRKR